MKLISDRKGFFIFLVLLLLMSVAMVYLYSPLQPGQDFYFHFRRLQSLMTALKDGCPSMIYLDYTAVDGYGYFTKISYSDFILIPFAVIGNITNALFAYQLIVFCMTILCGLFMYFAVDRVYRNPVMASFSAILYTFAFYRLFDLYLRAALGEALSFTFVPLVALGTYEIIAGNYKKWYWLSIGYALLILTHTLSPVLTFLVMGLFLLIYSKRLIKEPKRCLYLIVSGIVIVILSAYYLFPTIEQFIGTEFLYQRDKVIAQTQDLQLAPHWIMWGLFGGLVQPRQFTIPGIGLILTGVVCLRLFVYEKSNATLKHTDVLTIVGVFLVFACSTLFPWSYCPFNKLDFIQLPWRFYEFVSLLFAISGSYYLSLLLKTRKRILIGLIAVAITTLMMMASDSELFKSTRGNYDIYARATEWDSYHLSGVGFVSAKVPSIEYITARKDSIGVHKEGTEVSNFNRRNGITSFDLKISSEDFIELPLFYYKGYVASVDGKRVKVVESQNGLVEVSASSSGSVEVFYEGTTIQKISLWITLLGFGGIFLYIIVQNINKRQRNENGERKNACGRDI